MLGKKRYRSTVNQLAVERRRPFFFCLALALSLEWGLWISS